MAEKDDVDAVDVVEGLLLQWIILDRKELGRLKGDITVVDVD
jgi:hypothetical protein